MGTVISFRLAWGCSEGHALVMPSGRWTPAGASHHFFLVECPRQRGDRKAAAVLFSVFIAPYWRLTEACLFCGNSCSLLLYEAWLAAGFSTSDFLPQYAHSPMFPISTCQLTPIHTDTQSYHKRCNASSCFLWCSLHAFPRKADAGQVDWYVRRALK